MTLTTTTTTIGHQISRAKLVGMRRFKSKEFCCLCDKATRQNPPFCTNFARRCSLLILLLLLFQILKLALEQKGFHRKWTPGVWLELKAKNIIAFDFALERQTNECLDECKMVHLHCYCYCYGNSKHINTFACNQSEYPRDRSAFSCGSTNPKEERKNSRKFNWHLVCTLITLNICFARASVDCAN